MVNSLTRAYFADPAGLVGLTEHALHAPGPRSSLRVIVSRISWLLPMAQMGGILLFGSSMGRSK